VIFGHIGKSMADEEKNERVQHHRDRMTIGLVSAALPQGQGESQKEKQWQTAKS
jgi:hypothetical protein